MGRLLDEDDVIDAVQQHREGVLGGYEYDEGVAFVYAAAHNHIIEVVKQMPPAQPDARYINANELIKRLQQAGLDNAVSIAVKMAGHERLKHVPPAQSDLIAKIQNGINATNANDNYSCGMRNGMRWCMSLVDDEEPLFENCPSAQPEEIGYEQCANAMMKMWIDEVVTDGEYNRIMDKLNKHWRGERNEID